MTPEADYYDIRCPPFMQKLFLNDKERQRVIFYAKWRGALFEVADVADFDLRNLELRRNLRSLTSGVVELLR